MATVSQVKFISDAAHSRSRQIADDLAHAFAVPFQRMAKTDSWQYVDDHQPYLACAADTECEQACCAHCPILIPLDTQRSKLLVPLQCDGTPFVLSGVLTPEKTGLAVPLAMAIVANANSQQEVNQLCARLGEFTTQVTSDFEELTWLRGLSEHINLCTPQNDLAVVASGILPTLHQILEAEAVQVYLDDGDSREPQLIYETARPRCGLHSVQKVIEVYGRNPVRPVIVKNAAEPHGTIDSLDLVSSVLLVRLSRPPRNFGWILAINKGMGTAADEPYLTRAGWLSQYEFGTFEAGLLNAAALLLTTHAHNVETFRQIEQLLVGVIRAMINVIDAKDSYTCGHSDRVALLAKHIAREYGLCELEQQRVYMAGLLHDVGKIGVPDEVLGKPDRLTPEEFAMIKRHPEIGYAILKHLKELHYVLPGILYHHESFDGRGYPHQLAGADIPLIGRILAVADAYDAMTSDRPYRNGMPTAKAEAILREGAGKQWDADVVDAFFRMIDVAHSICGMNRAHTLDLLQPQQPDCAAIDPIAQAVLATLT